MDMNTLGYYLVSTTIFFLNFAAIYLIVNKLWKRKHEYSVAQSNSVIAALLALGNFFPLSLLALFKGDWSVFFTYLLFSCTYGFFLLVGIGFWVVRNQNHSFFSLLKQALRQEKGEVGTLSASLFAAKGQEEIVEVLLRTAYLDDELDPKEVDSIETFADRWAIPLPPKEHWKQFHETDPSQRYQKIHSAFVRYLSLKPDQKELAQLHDCVKQLIMADGELAYEEQLFFSEISERLRAYESGETKELDWYGVFLVPQTETQQAAIRSLMPQQEEYTLFSAQVYFLHSFFSRQYADEICRLYMEEGIPAFAVSRIELEKGAEKELLDRLNSL